MPKEKELFEKVKRLNEDKKYEEVISSLTEKLLEQHQSADLFAEKAQALFRSKQYNESWDVSEKALEIDKNHAKANTYHGYVLNQRKQFEKAIEYYEKATQTDPSFALAFHGMANAHYESKRYELAKDCYIKALELDPNYVYASYGLGAAYYNLREYEKAIEQYEKTIELDPEYSYPYNGLGVIYNIYKEFEKAIVYHKKAKDLDPENALSYNNLGNIYRNLGQFDKAIKEYLTGIELAPNYSLIRYNLGKAYYESKQYEKAIESFEKKIQLSKDDPDYFSSIAQERLEEIKKILDNEDYENINALISRITELLLFEGDDVTHYTGLSTTKALVLQESQFRLSEGTFLNDTAEGKELFDFLPEINSTSRLSNEEQEVKDSFTQKPFIGSFVAETKYNDLALWRMYGKEMHEEAKGCTLTIRRKQLLEDIRSKLTPEDVAALDERELRFYRVAYVNQSNEGSFIIPDAGESDIKELNDCMQELREKVEQFNKNKNTNPEDHKNLRERLNEIAYLFKSVEYQYEHEIRLVIKGIGFEKKIDIESNPPKVYIETIPVTGLIKQITLGPKVERAEEWVATFTYTFEKKGLKPRIFTSQLPFK